MEGDLLLGRRRLDPAAAVHVRGDARRLHQQRERRQPVRRRLRGRHLRLVAGVGGVQDGDDHRHDRPVLLRRLGHDQRLADDVRVQPRPSDPRPPALVEGHQVARAGQRHAAGGGAVPDRGAAGAVRQRRQHPVRVLRADPDHRDRPVHRVRDPDLPAVADGRRVRHRPVDAGQQVQVDVPDRRTRGDHRVHLLLAAVLPARHPRQRWLRARQRRGQLRADPRVRRDHRDRHLVGGLGQELVHRSRDPERLGRGGGAQLAHATEGAGRPAPSAPRGA